MSKAAGIAGEPQGARTRGLAVLALFTSLGATAASQALTLGDLQVRSRLGEPLSAVVQVDAAAGEVLRRECFAAGPDAAAIPGVPRTDDLRMVLERRGTSALLRLASRNAVREPLTQVVLQVRCPGLPRLTRAFVVLLDPAAISPDPAPLVTRLPRTAGRIASAPVDGDIAPGSRYLVRNGDTLSGIASRIAGRPPYSVWPLAAQIKTLNPNAFENGRADVLIAGSQLQIPELAGLTNTGRITTASLGSAETTVPATGSVRRTVTRQELAGQAESESRRLRRPLIEMPVLQGEPVAGTNLDYLVITLELSSLSRARIAERANAPEVAPVTEPAPVAVAEQAVVAPENAGSWFGRAWYWLLALLIVVAGGLFTFMYLRRRPETEATATEGSPWELGDDDTSAPAIEELEKASEAMLVEEPVAKVYDDFTGTFVDAVPDADKVAMTPKGADPEDDIQTHLMPTIEEASLPHANEDGLSLAVTDQPKLEGLEERVPVRKRSPEQQDYNVTTVEETEDQIGDDGWVELDFEATQILEQDYLAEYARSLKDKVKEQSEAQGDTPDDKGAFDSEDPLLAASELIEALDEDLLTAEMMELEDPSGPDATSEMRAMPDKDVNEDEDPTASVTTLELEADDNVIAIDKAKKNLDDDAEDQPRERGKKS